MPRLMVILALAVTAVALRLQAPPHERSEQEFKIVDSVELVLLDVSVEDAAGEHISNLNQDNFKVYEDGKLQRVTQFSSDDVPVTVGLVIDTSGSVRPKYTTLVTAALSFIQASNRSDEVFVVNFGERVTSGLPDGVPFTDNLERLRSALSLGVPAGRTALYDAILFSLHHLEMGKCAKKALMLISDGGDNHSSHGSGEVMQMVRESRATIYSIGIFDANDEDRNPALLRRLARVSGGEAFFPAKLTEVGAVCREIARDIRTRYTIGYTPVRSGDQGSIRKIKVTASTPSGRKLAVRTRNTCVLPPIGPSGAPESQPGSRQRR